MGIPQIAEKRDFDMSRVSWSDIATLRDDVSRQCDAAMRLGLDALTVPNQRGISDGA